MRGSVRKRCTCRDEQGRRVTNCRKPHGSWGFTIDAGRDPDTGKRRQIMRSGFRTRAEANEAMTRELAALDAGTWTDDRNLTLAAWLDQWLADLEAKGRSPKTLANYRGHSRDVWAPQLGHLRLRDIRRRHIERVLADLTQPLDGPRPAGNVGRRVQRRSSGTVHAYRRTIRAALGAARQHDLITINPAEGRLDTPTSPNVNDTTEKDPIRVWEPEQTARFLEHVTGDPLAALYEVAAYTGLRRGELCGLRWRDIDDDGAGVQVRQNVVEVSRSQITHLDPRCPTCRLEHVGRLIKIPKTAAGRRWVPLAQPARHVLAEHRRLQHEQRADFGPDYNDHGLVFAYPDGVPLRPGSLTKAFKAHTRACGLPIIRLHDMRHGACSLLLAGGVPIEIVQMILGHASPDITRKVYAHLLRSAVGEQVDKATELITRHRP